MLIPTCAAEIKSKMKRGASFQSLMIKGLYITDLGIEVLEMMPYCAYSAQRRLLVRLDCCGTEKTVSLDTLRTRTKYLQRACGACRKRMKHKDRPEAIRSSRHRAKAAEERARQENRDAHLWAHRCMSGINS